MCCQVPVVSAIDWHDEACTVPQVGITFLILLNWNVEMINCGQSPGGLKSDIIN